MLGYPLKVNVFDVLRNVILLIYGEIILVRTWEIWL